MSDQPASLNQPHRRFKLAEKTQTGGNLATAAVSGCETETQFLLLSNFKASENSSHSLKRLHWSHVTKYITQVLVMSNTEVLILYSV